MVVRDVADESRQTAIAKFVQDLRKVTPLLRDKKPRAVAAP
jgi:hypothetical protein